MSLPDSWIGRQDFKSISTFRSVSCVIRIIYTWCLWQSATNALLKQNSGRRKNHKFKKKYPKFISETGIV